MYASGCTAPPADDAAYDAYNRAADEGYPEAQIALSKLYLDRSGVPVVAYQAYFWARSRAALAAKSLSAFEIGDADKFVKHVIAAGSEPTGADHTR